MKQNTQSNQRKPIVAFTTNQCTVCVTDTGFEFAGNRIYVVTSYHNNGGKVNVRFGNKLQTQNMAHTYAGKKFIFGDEEIIRTL